MYWCSSAESEKLVKSVEDAYEKVKRLGPNPIKNIGMNISQEKAIKTQ
jgi:coenzyme F420-reducing hydrogenase delta subunit